MREKNRIKVLYIMTKCSKSGPIQQMFNLIKNLDQRIFKPYLITIYEEEQNGLSMLSEYKKIVEHTLINISKEKIIFGRTLEVKEYIRKIKPDIIHSFGVFPDYMVTKMKFKNHVLTSRNYVYDDYPDQYGKIKGLILAWVHLYAIKHTKYSHCCSKSLSNIYKEKLGMDIPFIKNGIDISKFSLPSDDEKIKLKKKLNLPENKKIVIYGGVFNERKNQEFLLKSVNKKIEFKDVIFLLLGDGSEYKRLKCEYETNKNILMPGNTTKMSDYLKAADYYVSTSKSEGLPNGVLEAMACGLPVLLSDIQQHKEILETDLRCGLLYCSGIQEDFVDKLILLLEKDTRKIGKFTRECIEKNYSAQIMSKNYQNLYIKINGE